MNGSGTKFYVTGGTLRPDAACYVERLADAELRDGLIAGHFCYVLTSRQMGKSSLMVRTVGRLRSEGHAVAVLDLTAIGQNLSVEQWYVGLLGRLGQQLDLEDELDERWEATARLSPVQRWFSALRDTALEAVADKKGLVIFVDEIDAVRSLPFSTDEFFAAIRECYNRRANDPLWERLTFCLLGVATPSDLIRDTRTTPFNIGQRIELGDFNREEAEALAVGMQAGRTGETARRLLNRILYWTHGQPYLTQRFCEAAAEASDIVDEAGIDALCDALFLSEKARERNDNLIFVRERILRSEMDRAGLLHLYQRVLRGKRVPDDPSNPLVCVLRLSGITRAVDGGLTVRNRIYREVFDRRWAVSNMPDAELRRQREAFISGILRTGAVALLILLALSFIAAIATRQRIEAQKNAQEAQASSREAGYQRGQAEAARREAEESAAKLAETLARMEMQQAETVMIAGRSTHAVAHLAHVLRDDPSNTVAAARLMSTLSQRSFARPTLRREEEPAPARSEPYYSPDFDYVIALNGDEARVFDMNTGVPITPPMMHDGPIVIEAREFSPDGGRIITGSEDNTARVWDAFNGEPLTPPLRHSGKVAGVTFSPDGLRAATVSLDRTVRVWDAYTGEPLTEPIRIPRGFGAALFSGDGRRIVMTPRDADEERRGFGGRGRLSIAWDIRPGKMFGLMFHHAERIESAEFSPDSSRLLTASRDGVAMIWDAQTGAELIAPLRHEMRIIRARFSPDGSLVATASDDRTARVWNAGTGEPLTPPLAHEGRALTVEFSPDGSLLATASEDRRARVWRVADGELLFEPIVLEQPVEAAHFSPDGRTLLTASDDRRIRFWDAATGKPRPGDYRIEQGRRRMIPFRRFRGRGPSEATEFITAQFSVDGGRILTMFNGTISSDVRIWDRTDGAWLSDSLDHNSFVRSARLNAAGEWIVTAAEDRTARVWTASTGDPLSRALEHDSDVVFADFFPDGRRVYTVTANHRARIWDGGSGMPISEPLSHAHEHRFMPLVREPHYASAVSPDGRWLAAPTSDNRLQIWEALAAEGAAPPWLPTLAEAVVGRRVDERGLLEGTPPNALNWLSDEMQPKRDGIYARWGAWFMADRVERAISPLARVSVKQYADQLVVRDTVQSLREALHIMPDNPLALSRLARLIEESMEPDNQRARQEVLFFSLRAAESAPTEPGRWLDHAETLGRLEEWQGAQQALAKFGETPVPEKDSKAFEKLKQRRAELREWLKQRRSSKPEGRKD